jgi:acetyl/propionyl-CoA carboxylase alpha subunit
MNRLVVANRGEIARRILRTARRMGFEVGVISTPSDRDAPVRTEADAVLEVSSFLNADEIVSACVQWGAHYLHPGYGFLSENAPFAALVERAGIVFVGPTPENMLMLGGKESSKNLARKSGVPTLDALLSHELEGLSPEKMRKELDARTIIAPYLVKASGGGGGRGMRVVEEFPDLANAIRRASEEAKASFGDGTVFVERYLKAPRHIEIQVFGDGKGKGVFFGERECSLQRRHQKVIEEAPSAVVDANLREKMGRAALSLVEATRYRGVGTVEFLLDDNSNFFFLEMNTRLQVEHPVTEAVWGLNLVDAQLSLALGTWPSEIEERFVQSKAVPNGVSFEARILAEDPRSGFLPTPGPVTFYSEPEGPGMRVDSGVCQGGKVNSDFDSMIAKLIVHGSSREDAATKLLGALENLIIHGCTTNIPFLHRVVSHPDFVKGQESTAWLAEHMEDLNAPLLPQSLIDFFRSVAFRTALAQALNGGQARAVVSPFEKLSLGNRWLNVGSSTESAHFSIRSLGKEGHFVICGLKVAQILQGDFPLSNRYSTSLLNAAASARRLNGEGKLTFWASRQSPFELCLSLGGETLVLLCPMREIRTLQKGTSDSLDIRAPMAGRVLEVLICEGDLIEEGKVVFVIESMKMQLEVRSPMQGRISAIHVEVGQILPGPQLLATFE